MRQKIQKDLLKAVSEILKIREKDLDPDEDLSGYGFDSITLTEFANRLNEKYNLEITPVTFFEYPSIGSFAQYLSQAHKDKLIQHYQDSLKVISPRGDQDKDAAVIEDEDAAIVESVLVDSICG